jgi:DNA-directed RNA polymerase subunit H (RpoH/RPB5)
MARKKLRKAAKINVAGHNLVPKHTKLSQKDKKALFEKYNILTKDLPKILIDDPVLVGLDVVEGDIVKIERKSITTGKTVYYRGVVNG